METGYAAPPFGDTEYTIDMSTELDIDAFDAINEQLITMSPKQRVEWAVDTFGNDLYFSTSAGVDSALMIDLISQVDEPISAIFINTGFLPPETLEFKDKLANDYLVHIHEFGPSRDQIDTIKELEIEGSRLWEEDPDTYSRITKLNPMSEAINTLGVKALLTGVRRDQTENRATLDYVGFGNDGEIRINPFLDWTSEQVKEYFKQNKLPRHPKYHQGYESVGDIHTTMPGRNRDGRAINECGLHVVDGKIVRKAS